MGEEFFPALETTAPDCESRAPDADSILRHVRERTQLLCAGGALLWVSRRWRGGADQGGRATASRKSRCCRFRLPAIGPARSLSRDAWTWQAIELTGWRGNPATARQ